MIRDLRRILWLVLVLSRQGLGIVLRRPRGMEGPQRLRQLLEDVGGTFLKFGQVLALQPDILPRRYCNALFDLLDRVPPFAFDAVERTLIEDLGGPPDSVFDTFEAVPIASASIGQVHVAEREGHRLAVKVQRPDVDRSFSSDLRIMRSVATFIRVLRLRRLAWLRRAIEEFVGWTSEELDYRHEARFMAALEYNSRDNDRERVPVVVSELTTRRVLVAEFLSGPMVVDYLRAIESGVRAEFEARLAETGFDAEDFARNVVRNFVSDAFHHGMFHADLHPANLLILPDSVVGYVDFGITGSLSAWSRRNLVALTLALTRADLDAMTASFLRLAATEDDSDVDAFRDGLAELIDEWFDTDRERPVMRASFTRVMIDMLQLSRETNLWPTQDVIRYIRSVITADGLVGRFAPGFDVGGLLESICEEYLQQETWQRWLSVENVADWTVEGSRLLSWGPSAALDLLRQLGSPDTATEASDEPKDRGAASLQWALLTVIASVAAAVSGGPQPLGVNLFTAALTVAAAAATMTVSSILRS